MKKILCYILSCFILFGCCFSLSGCVSETYATEALLRQLKRVGLWGNVPSEAAEKQINEMFEMYNKLKPYEQKIIQRNGNWMCFLSDVREYEKEIDEYIQELEDGIASLPSIDQISPADKTIMQEVINLAEKYSALSNKYNQKVSNISILEAAVKHLEQYKKTCPICMGEGQMTCNVCGGDGIRTIYGTYPVSGEKYIIGQERCGTMMYCPTCNGRKFVYGD